MEPPIACRSRFFARLVGSAALACTSLLPAQSGTQLLWSNPWSNYTVVSSRLWTSPMSDLEAADDFDVNATITRVVFDGHGCFNCTPPVVLGVSLRFYSWNNGDPGTLLYQTFLPAGAPGLLYDPVTPGTVDFTLPAPFLATGRHFVSMQMIFQGGGYWDVWASDVNTPRLSPVRVRDNLAGTGWTTPTVSPASTALLYSDLTFELFGTTGNGPPSIPCVTWSELPTQSPTGASYCLLRGVKAFAANDVWAAGHAYVQQGPNNDQVTVTMHWDGATWTQVPSPSPAPAPGLTNCILWALDGAASNDLWAAGTYQTRVNGGWVGQQVFAMHWDGQTWNVPQNLPVPNTSVGAGISGSSIYDVKALASNDVWFAGDWLDVIQPTGLTTRPGFLMHWDGSLLTQTVLPVVTGVGHQYFNSVTAIAANDVWVAGGAGTPGNLPGSSVPVLFHFDGSNWTHTPCATPNLPGWDLNLYDVEMLATNDVWVFGVASTQFPTVQSQNFMSHWDGASWSLLPGAPLGGTAIKVVSAGEIYSVGMAVWRWDGTSWTQTQAFTSQLGAGLDAVDAIGPCEVFAVGGQTRISQIAPFAERLDAPWYWRTNERLPTQPMRAPGTLHALTPPLVGSQLRIGIDDPGSALGVGQAVTFWLLAAAPAAGYPAPAPFAFGGTNGALGEVFVDLQTIGFVSPSVAFVAGGGPAVHTVTIPNRANLVGIDVFSQGLLLDPSNPANLNFTNGLDLHLGW